MTHAPVRIEQPAYTHSLRRHFADLRDGTHGGAVTRRDKEELFFEAVDLLRPYALQVLKEMNEAMLLGQGIVKDSGTAQTLDGPLRSWTLSWEEQRSLALPPVSLHAYYGRGFHHPHLRGGTVREWPMNVFTAQHAAEEVPLLRSIASADLHNLVFMADFTIVPACAPGTTYPTR
ncbi:hypothetical protein D6T63_13400 [Arthrobacter cheniae]|uniref:Uncharacterized protein n=1 Tax=Arthrobacter cheniae TaxID=1258888 RepID=A0A3A5M9A6_9MICC|nr:hypothetical protein D6T63_13400 [Arthrobacter cheniae]